MSSFGEDQLGQPVDAHGVAQEDAIQPTDPPGPASGGAEFIPWVGARAAQMPSHVTRGLSWEGPFADPGLEGLGGADDLGDGGNA